MSVVVALHVSDAIIMASDSLCCMHGSDENAPRVEDIQKIKPLSNHMAVGHVGSKNVDGSMSMDSVLDSVQDKALSMSGILDVRNVPCIVADVLRDNYHRDDCISSYLVTGYAPNGIAHAYYIRTDDVDLISMRCGRGFHWWCIGVGESVVKAMLKDVEVESLSMKDGVMLARGIVTAVIKSSMHGRRYVGGLPWIYVMAADGQHDGWVDRDGSIVPDGEYVFDEKGVLHRGTAYGRELS